MITEILAVPTLAILSIYDLRTREIPAKAALAGAALVAASRIVEGVNYHGIIPLKIYAAIDLTVISLLALTAFIGALGWGDVVAAVIVAIASPFPPRNSILFPAVLLTIAYYVLIMILFSIGLAAYNLAVNRKELRKLPPKYRLVYVLIARPIAVKDFLKGRARWWYPLHLCGKYRISFNIYLNPEDVEEQVRKALAKGCVRRGEKLWSTYGIPALPLLTIAYTLSLLLGDKPLLKPLLHL